MAWRKRDPNRDQMSDVPRIVALLRISLPAGDQIFVDLPVDMNETT